MQDKKSSTSTIPKTSASSSFLKNDEQQEEDFGMNIYICENTDCILNPLEQMTYALNETQVQYGSIVILKNAP
ncbi:MAG: hypothetical protein M3093_02200 [Thermoproteota archaeon]|nr:hypothetical protein [Thermoproteota archaeon]